MSLVILFGVYLFLFSPPSNFPSDSIVVVAQGASAPEISEELAKAHVVAHPLILRVILRVSGTSSHIQSGAYRFEKPQNIFVIAYRLVTGDFNLPLVRVTFPEGTTVRGVAAQVAQEFPAISAAAFYKAGNQYEGYLFPDTYFFPTGTDTETILKKMRSNFDTNTAPISREIRISGHSLSDVVIMASLIEKEARTDTDKHLISGILWNRIMFGMPLQVDAARDTYQHTGLPKVPICNPGLESIEAALRPTKTDYFYYLTGRDDLMHYATTFAGHQANRRKYLD
ncbi:MAG: endolytic transglycosylase MltG [Candidatus Kaiserbacteria bacterium]|nr:endolytic transglycosylase MltG [Candidatus Kaiserbacteria bacterium]